MSCNRALGRQDREYRSSTAGTQSVARRGEHAVQRGRDRDRETESERDRETESEPERGLSLESDVNAVPWMQRKQQDALQEDLSMGLLVSR